jgi:NAD(P)H-nitrite reductase large subunit
MGGILIGDAKDYSKLLQLSKKDDLAGNDPVALAFKLPPPGASSAVADGGDGTGMTDDDLICTCLALSKGQVRNAIIDMEAYTIPLIKKACKAGTGCGGCCTPVGEVPKLLAHTLKKLGKAGASGICSHFKYSRKELFDIVKVKELKSLEEILSAVGQGSPDGCELCKPVVASILSGLWNDHALKAGRDQIQEIQSPYHDKRQRINDKRNISMMRVYLAMTTSYCMISFESLNKYIYANYLTSCF